MESDDSEPEMEGIRFRCPCEAPRILYYYVSALTLILILNWNMRHYDVAYARARKRDHKSVEGEGDTDIVGVMVDIKEVKAEGYRGYATDIIRWTTVGEEDGKGQIKLDAPA